MRVRVSLWPLGCIVPYWGSTPGGLFGCGSDTAWVTCFNIFGLHGNTKQKSVQDLIENFSVSLVQWDISWTFIVCVWGGYIPVAPMALMANSWMWTFWKWQEETDLVTPSIVLTNSSFSNCINCWLTLVISARKSLSINTGRWGTRSEPANWSNHMIITWLAQSSLTNLTPWYHMPVTWLPWSPIPTDHNTWLSRD